MREPASLTTVCVEVAVALRSIQRILLQQAPSLLWAGAVVLAAAGCEGPQGPDGPVGPTGPAGQQGPRGPRGESGADGLDGQRGTAGQDGQPGAPGRDGEDGQDGLPGMRLTTPDMTLTIMDATVDTAGNLDVVFSLKDARGTALDREGVFTDGPVSVSFVAAWLSHGTTDVPGSYTAYTVRTQTPPGGGTPAVQPSSDTGGTFTLVSAADGVYNYRFGTTLTVSDDTATHTVGAWASRSVEGVTHVANAVHHFVPAGGTVTESRDIIDGQKCLSCHGEFRAHGGARRELALCLTCHQSATGVLDPDTGNLIDFRAMVHKLHQGEHLASVLGGTPFQIIGYQQSVHDYSTVAFPQDPGQCTACHSTGSAHAERWATGVSRANCTTCHDRTSFEVTPPAGYVAHSLGPQGDDQSCTLCHGSSVGVAPIMNHGDPVRAAGAPRVELAITEVGSSGPGQQAVVRFTVKVNGAARDITAEPLTTLTAVMAGPTTDYAQYWTATIQGNNASGTLTAVDAPNGVFEYQFPADRALPADAAGSYAFALEGYLQPVSNGPRYAAFNPVFYAAVTDATPQPRRQVVDTARCLACHGELLAHGGQRKNPEECVMCHHANNVNDERAPRFAGTTAVAHSVHFKVMVHKIHAGEHLLNGYVLGGFPAPSASNPAGTPVDFSEVRFPRFLNDCAACHLPGTSNLPLPGGVLPSQEQVLGCADSFDGGVPDGAYCTTRTVESTLVIPAEAATCTACHDGTDTVAHAMVMTTSTGLESCATCHGPGREFAVEQAHQLSP